jgi:hypothetical protein
MVCMAHSDTRWLVVSLIGLLASAGCEQVVSVRGDAGGALDAGPDASDTSRDAEADDASSDGGRDADPGDAGDDWCAIQGAREQKFVEANRACSSHADCVALGDCSNADFIAVSASAREQAEALIDARECRAQDGPTYHAVCREGACELAYARFWCGTPEHTLCPEGQQFHRSGCGSSAPLLAGCFTPCSEGDASACSPGYTCQEADIDPCGGGGEGGDTCTACAATVHLCRPAPGCQVHLSLTLDGASRVSLSSDGAAKLAVQLSNRTDAPITLSFDVPCHGPQVTGLGAHDVWDACLAGPCSEDVVRRTVTLAAKQTLVLAEALLAPVATACNPEVLATESYRPSVSLQNVSGAVLCTNAAAQLDVHDSPTQW